MQPHNEEQVVLVDEHDEPLGILGKLEAHRQGLLHRAFSVFLFDGEGRLLLQQRALGKYHSGGLWTNTCCSHPRPGEPVRQAAERRCLEEMGIRCVLEERFSFIYRAVLADGLTEHEFDHVLFGRFDGVPRPDPREVMATTWIHRDALGAELHGTPERFTPWLHRCWPEIAHHWPPR